MFENFPHKRRTDLSPVLHESSCEKWHNVAVKCIHEGRQTFWRYRKYQSENRGYARFVKFYITDIVTDETNMNKDETRI